MPVATVALTDARTARKALRDGATALDVREPGEFSAGHIPRAVNIPLGRLARETSRVPRDWADDARGSALEPTLAPGRGKHRLVCCKLARRSEKWARGARAGQEVRVHPPDRAVAHLDIA